MSKKYINLGSINKQILDKYDVKLVIKEDKAKEGYVDLEFIDKDIVERLKALEERIKLLDDDYEPKKERKILEAPDFVKFIDFKNEPTIYLLNKAYQSVFKSSKDKFSLFNSETLHNLMLFGKRCGFKKTTFGELPINSLFIYGIFLSYNRYRYCLKVSKDQFYKIDDNQKGLPKYKLLEEFESEIVYQVVPLEEANVYENESD
jgi:hypothetical protein